LSRIVSNMVIRKRNWTVFVMGAGKYGQATAAARSTEGSRRRLKRKKSNGSPEYTEIQWGTAPQAEGSMGNK